MPDLKSLAFVGVDTHKDQHTARLTDCFSHDLGILEVPNHPSKFEEFTSRVTLISSQNGLKPVYGLEDTQGLGQSLARFLVSTGNYVKDVNPLKTDRKRSKSPHPDKSDPDDGLAICKVLIQEFDKLPTIATFDEVHLAIRELSNHRESLVKEQTKVKNRLHVLIHREYPLYKRMFKTTFSKSATTFWERFPHPSHLKGSTVKSLAHFLRRHSHNTVSTRAAQRILDLVSTDGVPSELDLARAATTRSLVRHLRFLQNEITPIEKELRILVAKTGFKLQTLTGVDTVVAAKLINYIGDINRFSSSDKLAKCAGIAPTKNSTGRKLRHKKTKGGHRKLHATIYYIALSQIGKDRAGNLHNPKARQYYLRKIAEGKSKKEALTCLMRRLCDIIYAMMKNKTAYRKPE